MRYKRYVSRSKTRNSVNGMENASGVHIDVYEALSDYTQETGRIVHAANFHDVVSTAVGGLMRSQKLRDLLNDTCDRALTRHGYVRNPEWEAEVEAERLGEEGADGTV